MSVLIKGMKMPENCAKCICADDDGRFCAAAHEYIPMLESPLFARLSKCLHLMEGLLNLLM